MNKAAERFTGWNSLGSRTRCGRQMQASSHAWIPPIFKKTIKQALDISVIKMG